MIYYTRFTIRKFNWNIHTRIN